MPLFFVISGYLAGDSNIQQSIVKESKRLLIPFIATTTMLLFIECLKWLAVAAKHHDLALMTTHLIPMVYGSILGIGYGTGSLHPVCTPLWFLITLFYIKLFHSVHNSLRWHLPVGILCLIVSVYMSNLNMQIVPPFVITVLAYPFYLAGALLKQIEFKYVSS